MGSAGTERSYTPLLTSRGTSGEHNSGVLKHFTEQVPSRQRTGIWPTSDDNDLVEHGRILHLFFTGRHVWLSRVNMTQCRKGMRTLLRLIMAGNQNTPIGGLFLERNILRRLLGWQYLSMLRRSSIWPEHEGSVPDIDFAHLRHLLKLLATRWERTISKHDCQICLTSLLSLSMQSNVKEGDIIISSVYWFVSRCLGSAPRSWWLPVSEVYSLCLFQQFFQGKLGACALARLWRTTTRHIDLEVWLLDGLLFSCFMEEEKVKIEGRSALVVRGFAMKLEACSAPALLEVYQLFCR